jgi:Reverse transcriptase (RNA-dependent DNA polymerase)
MNDWTDNDIFDNDIECSVISDLDAWTDNNTGLKFLHVNIRSLKHWNELLVVLQNQIGVFDALLLSEINTKQVDNSVNLDGYNAYWKPRLNRGGGGLLLFLKDKFQFKEINIIFNSFECISGIISTGHKESTFNFLGIYRPPCSSKSIFINELERYIVNTELHNVIIIGDMNLNLLNNNDHHVHDYEAVLAGNGFYKCINDVTREEFRDNVISVSCIDHIFVRCGLVPLSSAILTCKVSDHYLIALAIDCEKISNLLDENMQDRAKSRCLNEKLLCKKLNEIEWDQISTTNNVDDLYDAIVVEFDKCYKTASYDRPISNNKKHPRKQWMTKELLMLVQERDQLFRKWKQCHTSLKMYYRKEFKVFRNNVCKQIMNAKNVYYRDRIDHDKRSSRVTWQTINEVLGRKKSDTVDRVVSKHLGKFHSDEEIANTFAKTFINDVEQIQHKCNITTLKELNNSECQSIFMQPVTSKMVFEIIQGMDGSKQPGLDGIRACDLKHINKKVCHVIAKLVNLSIQSGTVPAKLKISIIRPVYKKGDHLIYSNYRPIAILCIIEKILERCIYMKLIAYLDKHNILNKLQFGFQKNKSTSDLLSHFSNYINSKLNDNKHVIAIFIDFSKAFDTINHSKLISILENIGIRGPALQWFTNYLQNRSMLVKIGSNYSSKMTCNTGVPQGSILGPLLYLIYVNRMSDCIMSCQSYMYADDTVILASHKSLKMAESYIQNDFNNILKWCHDHELVINSSKTKIIHICSPFNQDKLMPIDVTCHSYTCLHSLDSNSNNCNSCNTKIDVVKSHVYLGVNIDKHFTWRPHIDDLCKRLRHCAFSLYKLKYIFPFEIIRTVYLALVESLISYGLLCWGTASKSHIRKIVSIQNRIITIITPDYVRQKLHYNVAQYYNYCNFLPVTELFTYNLLIKHYYDTQFKTHEDHSANTRLRLLKNYKLPTFQNKNGKRVLQYLVPKTFNSIPSNIRTLDKYTTAKKCIKNWLFSNISNI